MRKYLIIGSSLALLASGGVAMAQMPPGGPNGQGGPGAPGGPHGPGMGPQEQWNMHRHWEMMEHMHHHRAEGTSFRFRKGDASVEVKCSDSEPVQACVNAAGTLLDKLHNVQSQPGQTTPQ
jgi:hypothetical protein